MSRTTPSEEDPPVDPRNRLNALTGAEWIQETKSFFFQKGLGASHEHAEIERAHPAPFSFQDVQRLIEFFSKPGDTILDPFGGVGSTAKAAALVGRRSISLEIEQTWHTLSKERLRREVPEADPNDHVMRLGDCRDLLPEVERGSIAFVVTSPPYWSILNKKPDHKALERASEGLALSYSDDPRDLGNILSYDAFLEELAAVFHQCIGALKVGGYLAIVVSDFRHGSKFYSFHSDLIRSLDGKLGHGGCLALKGTKILLQNQKSLKPYGYPFAYVENIHHQYILIFRKEER